MAILILNHSLDEWEDSIVIRGQIFPEDLSKLGLDTYQREGLSHSTNRHIWEALESGERLPDIELGMRGSRTKDVEGGHISLLDNVYIIDGQQRRNTTQLFLGSHPTNAVRLGAIIHLNTNFEWEKARFHVLNAYAKRVAASVLLRNSKEEYLVIAALFGLSNDRRFPLFGHIGWNQNTAAKDWMTGAVYLSICMALHRIILNNHDITSIALRTLDYAKTLQEKIGFQQVRENALAYFKMVDTCWGLSDSILATRGTQTRAGFHRALALVIARHQDFWVGPALKPPHELVQKLSKFPIHNPDVAHLAGRGGPSTQILYQMIVDHLNRRRPVPLKEFNRVEVELGGVTVQVPTDRQTPNTQVKRMDVVLDRTVRILQVSGKPMSRREVFAQFHGKPEFQLLGTDPYNNFSKLVSRSFIDGRAKNLGLVETRRFDKKLGVAEGNFSILSLSSLEEDNGGKPERIG